MPFFLKNVKIYHFCRETLKYNVFGPIILNYAPGEFFCGNFYARRRGRILSMPSWHKTSTAIYVLFVNLTTNYTLHVKASTIYTICANLNLNNYTLVRNSTTSYVKCVNSNTNYTLCVRAAQHLTQYIILLNWSVKNISDRRQCTMRTLESRNSSGLIAPGYILKNHQKYLKERHFSLSYQLGGKLRNINFRESRTLNFQFHAGYAPVSYDTVSGWV